MESAQSKTRLTCPECGDDAAWEAVEKLTGLAGTDGVTLDSSGEQLDIAFTGESEIFFETSETVALQCGECATELSLEEAKQRLRAERSVGQ